MMKTVSIEYAPMYTYSLRFYDMMMTFLCRSQRPVIPPTVSDQIRLWELERDRFRFSEGVLYNQFLSQADFQMLRDYAKVKLSSLKALRLINTLNKPIWNNWLQ